MAKRKRIFISPEERAAWEARSQETLRRLNDHIERITAEVTRGMTPKERAAWQELHRDNDRALQFYLERGQTELEAKRKSAQ
jgi:hypothetical protein